MGRRNMSAQERREYEKLQERKKQRIERQQARSIGANSEKTVPGTKNRPDEYRKTRRPDPSKKRKHEEERGRYREFDGVREKKKNRGEFQKRRPEREDVLRSNPNREKIRRKEAEREGLQMGDTEPVRRNVKRRRPPREKKDMFSQVMLVIQAIVSFAFLGVLVLSNIIPLKYIVVIFIGLLILWGISLFSQMKRRKNGMFGKVYMVLISLLIVLLTYYICITTGALAKITGGSSTVDTMVVAVRADDPAESLADAENYKFGVQYTMGGEEMKNTVSTINEELGRNIDEVEYKNIKAQAQALHDGDVDAIVYDEGYRNILESEFHGYSKKIKIIYTHKIETKLKDISLDVDVAEPFSVYLSGIDVYGDISQKSRSDVNIIASVNPKTRQILLITTPRDYYVEIPEISEGQKDKLTHAGNYGVDASIRTLSQLYDVEIPFYARVNFTSMIDIVDILGGLDVVSEYAFTTSTNSGKVIDVKEGLNHFDGKEALAFARERKKVPGGDNQRGKDQQAVLTAMIKKMVAPSMLLKANSIIEKVSDNVETNMSQRQLQALIKRQLSVGGSWNIKSVSAEGIGDSQACYSSGSQRLYVTIPDEESIEMIKTEIDKLISGEILEDGEKTE